MHFKILYSSLQSFKLFFSHRKNVYKVCISNNNKTMPLCPTPSLKNKTLYCFKKKHQKASRPKDSSTLW